MRDSIEKRHRQMDEAIREAMGSTDGQWLRVGENFRFICEHGSHYHVLDGMITGIELSDEGGLEVEVSNRTMWGRPIMYLAFTKERGWTIRLEQPESYFDGHFEVS